MMVHDDDDVDGDGDGDGEDDYFDVVDDNAVTLKLMMTMLWWSFSWCYVLLRGEDDVLQFKKTTFY